MISLTLHKPLIAANLSLGVTVFPDWFSANITAFWNNEFMIFFDPETGIDIDALWIDMSVIIPPSEMT